MPMTNMCAPKAPIIVPIPRSAPNHTNLGNNSNATIKSSTTPDPILPHGSAPREEKIKTDSSAALNLKNKV